MFRWFRANRGIDRRQEIVVASIGFRQLRLEVVALRVENFDECGRTVRICRLDQFETFSRCVFRDPGKLYVRDLIDHVENGPLNVALDRQRRTLSIEVELSSLNDCGLSVDVSLVPRKQGNRQAQGGAEVVAKRELRRWRPDAPSIEGAVVLPLDGDRR